jgi:3-oxoacyl-[acyl-carrier protein] reductase
MDLGIQNRNFLITGASRGIGRAIAGSLLIERANIGLVARRQDQLIKRLMSCVKNMVKCESSVGW